MPTDVISPSPPNSHSIPRRHVPIPPVAPASVLVRPQLEMRRAPSGAAVAVTAQPTRRSLGSGSLLMEAQLRLPSPSGASQPRFIPRPPMKPHPESGPKNVFTRVFCSAPVRTTPNWGQHLVRSSGRPDVDLSAQRQKVKAFRESKRKAWIQAMELRMVFSCEYYFFRFLILIGAAVRFQLANYSGFVIDPNLALYVRLTSRSPPPAKKIWLGSGVRPKEPKPAVILFKLGAYLKLLAMVLHSAPLLRTPWNGPIAREFVVTTQRKMEEAKLFQASLFPIRLHLRLRR